MFVVNRKLLLDELALLQTVAEVKTTMPVLAYTKFEFDGKRLVLTATNMDVSIVTEVDGVEGEPWSGCLPSAQLYALVKLLTDETVSFKDEGDGRLNIKAGRARHKLPVLPISNFPLVQGLSGDGFSLSLPLLTKMIEATAFSALPFVEHLKPSDIKFTGVSLRAVNGRLEVAASQKVVTGVAEVDVDVSDFTVLIPQQAAAALRRLEGETVTIKRTENAVEFTAGPRTIIARQLMGEFPQWRQFVPPFPWAVTLSGDELRAAIKRATVTMGTDNAVGYEPMKATFARESVTIETRGGDKGKSDEVVDTQSNMNGEALSVGFINGQVLSVLGQCGERVTCHLAAWDKPMMFKPEVEGMELTFIVMPVGVKW
jgi:DNA polymerase-3 subunit beta